MNDAIRDSYHELETQIKDLVRYVDELERERDELQATINAVKIALRRSDIIAKREPEP